MRCAELVKLSADHKCFATRRAEAHSCLTKSLLAANNADLRAYRQHNKVLLITCSYQGIANTFVQLRRLLVSDLIAAIPAAMFGMMRLDQGERG